MKRAIITIAYTYEWDAKLHLDIGHDMLGIGGFFANEARYDIVVPLLNASCDVVLAKVAHVKSLLNPGDLLVIYFCGHGIQRDKQCLVTTRGNELELLCIWDLHRVMSGKGLVKVMFLDCCRNHGDASDLGVRTRGMATVLPEDLRDMGVAYLPTSTAPESYAIFSACAVDQTAGQEHGTGKGFFSTAVKRVLQQAYDSGKAVCLDSTFRDRINLEMQRIGQQQNVKVTQRASLDSPDSPQILPPRVQSLHRTSRNAAVLVLLLLILSTAGWLTWRGNKSGARELLSTRDLKATSPATPFIRENRPPTLEGIATQASDHTAPRLLMPSSPPITHDTNESPAKATTNENDTLRLDAHGVKMICRRCPPSGEAAANSEAFYLGETLVTYDQFKGFVDATGYKTVAESDGGWTFPRKPGRPDEEAKERVCWRDFEKGDHPVVMVCLADVLAFCRWLERQTGYAAQLPTVAQWQTACLAGKKSAYWWGDSMSEGGGKVNAADQSLKKIHPRFDTLDLDDGFAFTSPVKHFQPNPWGLYDMQGNVEEIVADPVADHPGKIITVGGSWFSTARELSATLPMNDQPTHDDEPRDTIGFRILVMKR